jgi:hypothetical protein
LSTIPFGVTVPHGSPIAPWIGLSQNGFNRRAAAERQNDSEWQLKQFLNNSNVWLSRTRLYSASLSENSFQETPMGVATAKSLGEHLQCQSQMNF